MIKRILSLVALLLVCGSALAQHVADIRYSYSNYPFKTSVALVCAQFATDNSAGNQVYTCTQVVEGTVSQAPNPHGSFNAVCSITTGGSCGGTGTVNVTGSWYCADGSVMSYPANWGSPGVAPQCSGPPPPPPCPAGGADPLDITIGWATGKDVGSAATYLFDPVKKPFATSNFCVNQCVQHPDGLPKYTYQDQTPSENGYYRIFAEATPMRQEAMTCTVGNGPGQIPPPAMTGTAPTVPNTFNGKCPTGSVPSGQDSSGMTICIGTATQAPTSSTTTTTTPTTTTTDASGNSVSTSSSTNTNSDGSTTTVTTTTTTAPDGTKSVSVSSNTTASTSGGAGTTDPRPDQPPTDICKLHPELNICKNSQVMGACALVTCDGDAIQCATLRAASAMQCAQQADQDALAKSSNTALGNSILSGADPMQGSFDAMKAGTVTDLSSQNLDQSGFLGGGSCLPDKTFTVSGHAVVVSFSALCSQIQPLRAVIMSVAFILAYLLVSRAVLQS